MLAERRAGTKPYDAVTVGSWFDLDSCLSTVSTRPYFDYKCVITPCCPSYKLVIDLFIGIYPSSCKVR